MFIVPIGIDLMGFQKAPLDFNPPIIGYLSRMCETHGLDILVDAFIRLKKNERLDSLKLAITGGYLAEDREFVKQIHRQLAVEK